MQAGAERVLAPLGFIRDEKSFSSASLFSAGSLREIGCQLENSNEFLAKAPRAARAQRVPAPLVSRGDAEERGGAASFFSALVHLNSSSFRVVA